MSKHTVEKTMRKELEHLNQVIDLKIIKGASYAAEARRHKFLSRGLARLKAERNQSKWFGTFKFASLV